MHLSTPYFSHSFAAVTWPMYGTYFPRYEVTPILVLGSRIAIDLNLNDFPY